MAIEKGDRVEIVGGKQGVGEEGDVFWVGPSKYGKGLRVGVKTDAGETVWAAEKQVRVLGGGDAGEPGEPVEEEGQAAPIFYGFDASDWHDEAAYTICFREEPKDEATFEKIIAAMHAAPLPLGWQARYVWSGRLLGFESHFRGRGAVRKWVRAVHRAVPVQDVAYEGARESDAPKTKPAPAPESKILGSVWRPKDASLPEWATNPTFESVQLRLSRAAQRKTAQPKLKKLLAKQKKKASVVFELVDDCAHVSPGDPQFACFNVPAERTVHFEGNVYGAAEQLAAGDHPLLDGRREALAWVVRETRQRGSLRETFAYVLDGERREAKLPSGLDCTSVGVHPSEPRALVVASGLVFEVDLPSGEAALKLWSGAGTRNAAYLADGHWAAQLTVFDQDDQPVDCVLAAAHFVRSVGGGRGLLVGPRPLGIYSFAKGRLSLEAELKADGFQRVVSLDGDPVIELSGGTIAARGVDAAFEAATAKKASRRKMPPLPQVVRFLPYEGARPEAPPVGGKQEVAGEAQPGAAAKPDLPESAGEVESVAASPSGSHVAFRKPGDPWVYVYDAASGETQQADYDPDFYAMRDDGTLVAHGAVGTRWRRRPTEEGPKSEEWPGLVQKPLGQKTRIEYLPKANAVVVYLPGGEFCLLAPDEKSVRQFWRGRGFESMFEVDDGIVLEGCAGRYLAVGLAERLTELGAGAAR